MTWGMLADLLDTLADEWTYGNYPNSTRAFHEFMTKHRLSAIDLGEVAWNIRERAKAQAAPDPVAQ